MWEIEGTDEFAAWYRELDEADRARVSVAIDWLIDKGPTLGRPFAETIKGSRYPNMKELRPRGGFLRILFAFDPRRTAILLIGGDKRGRWDEWYAEMIPLADALYGTYLAELMREGEL